MAKVTDKPINERERAGHEISFLEAIVVWMRIAIYGFGGTRGQVYTQIPVVRIGFHLNLWHRQMVLDTRNFPQLFDVRGCGTKQGVELMDK